MGARRRGARRVGRGGPPGAVRTGPLQRRAAVVAVAGRWVRRSSTRWACRAAAWWRSGRSRSIRRPAARCSSCPQVVVGRRDGTCWMTTDRHRSGAAAGPAAPAPAGGGRLRRRLAHQLRVGGRGRRRRGPDRGRPGQQGGARARPRGAHRRAARRALAAAPAGLRLPRVLDVRRRRAARRDPRDARPARRRRRDLAGARRHPAPQRRRQPWTCARAPRWRARSRTSRSTGTACAPSPTPSRCTAPRSTCRPRRSCSSCPTSCTSPATSRGTVTDGATSLELVASLHPSAAVCGTPTQVALELIREVEGLDRGRYAGPVGWLDASGDGEWGIALRCAQLDPADPRRLRLFAGCGIVAGSKPDRRAGREQRQAGARCGTRSAPDRPGRQPPPRESRPRASPAQTSPAQASPAQASWPAASAASSAAPTMPASLSSAGRAYGGAGLQQVQPLLGLLAHAAAEHDEVGPHQQVQVVQQRASAAWPTCPRTGRALLRAASEARFSTSCPSSSRWPNSVLGTSRPSRNSALPIPVPSVSSSTVPGHVLAPPRSAPRRRPPRRRR